MGFETWNVRSLCVSESMETPSRKLAKYRLQLVGVQGWLGIVLQCMEGRVYNQLWTGVLYTTELNHHKKEFVSAKTSLVLNYYYAFASTN